MIRPHCRFATIVAASAFLWACEIPVEPDVETGGPVADFLRSAAAKSQSTNNYGAAVSYYQSLSSRDANDIEALLGLARNLRYVGAAGDAIDVLKKGMANHPDRVDLRAELGKAQLAKGLANDAIDTLTEVTEAVPDDWRSFSALGIGYDLVEKFPEAQASYEAALAASPNNVAVLNNMALSKALADDLDGGIDILERATGLPMPGVQVRQNLALLYAMRGDIDTAGRLLEQGLTEDMAQHNLTFYRQLHSRLASRVGTKRLEQPAAAAEPADEASTAALEGGADGVAGGEPAPVARAHGLPAQGLMVRLGVYSTEEAASAWLAALRDVHADLFADIEFEIADVGTGEAASGYRLLAGPLASEALAADLCTKLHSRRETCSLFVP